jgi:hypothetical protein
MPANGLSTGIDHKLVFVDINGVEQFVIIENFTAKEDAVVGKEIAIDGTVRHPKFHEGWSGSFTLQRSSNFQDNYFALQEASYYQGVDQLPIVINETITETSGILSQYQYTNVVLTFESAGNWSGTEIVKQNITFMASRRLELV